MVRSWVVSVVVLAALQGSISGCKGDGGGGGGGPTLEELAPSFAAAICGEVKECGGDTFLAEQLGGQACVDSLTGEVEDKTFVELKASVDAGLLTYDASKADACLSSVRKAGCSIVTQRLGQLDGCDEVFVGTVAVGGDCDVDEACTGDAYCMRGNACPGTCTERSAVGETCSRNEECKNDLDCSDEGKCQRPSEEGEKCGATGQAPCALGLICKGAVQATNTAGECTPNAEAFKAKEGETCDPSGTYCEPPLSCAAAPGALGVVWTCKKPAASGGKCSLAAPSMCPTDENCDGMSALEGKCQPLPEAGQACRNEPMIAGPACAPGLICGSDDKCREIGRIGDACGEDGDCSSAHCDADKCAEPELCKID